MLELGSTSIYSSQSQFIDEVQLTDLKLLVSSSWLSEVFQQVIHDSLLEVAGYRDMGRHDQDESALVQMLIGTTGKPKNRTY